jgi:hypothetical protein
VGQVYVEAQWVAQKRSTVAVYRQPGIYATAFRRLGGSCRTHRRARQSPSGVDAVAWRLAEWSMAVVLKNRSGILPNSRFSLQSPHVTADRAF